MGLAVTAPDDGEIKSRRERIEEVYGSGGDVWKTYKDDLDAIEKGLQAAAACVVLVATIERGKEGTLDAIAFVDKDGDKVVQACTNLMFSTMYLAKAADVLSRGFGKLFAKSISLTLVEFESDKTAQKASPVGTWSRAVPILDENQKVKELGELTMELARSLG